MIWPASKTVFSYGYRARAPFLVFFCRFLDSFPVQVARRLASGPCGVKGRSP